MAPGIPCPPGYPLVPSAGQKRPNLPVFQASNLVAGAVKNLIPVGDQLAATRLVEAIMEQKSTPEVHAMLLCPR